MSSPLLLAVDDEVGVRESLKMVFCKEYRLLEAASVDAAIHKVQEEKPHVVLLDILMPKNGIEILRQIKAIHPGCEVIILTGVNSQQLAAKAGFRRVRFHPQAFRRCRAAPKSQESSKISRKRNRSTNLNRKKKPFFCGNIKPRS